MLRTLLLYSTGIAVVAAASLAHGKWTGRWRNTDAVARASASLGRVPLSVGEWVGTDQKTDEGQFARLGADGFLVRQYQNRVTGAAVTVMIECGRPGPMSVHTPDICYSGAGYTEIEAPKNDAVPDGPGASAQFNKQDFHSVGSATGETLTVRWGWHALDSNSWSAPANPRWEFARSPALYKMYVVYRMAAAADDLKADPAHDFLVEFLPRLGAALAVPAGS